VHPFAFLDDHSRAVVGHRWGYSEDSVGLAAALRPALAARGVPEGVYVDNGSAFIDKALLRAMARLGIKLIHSTPGRPKAEGKSSVSLGLSGANSSLNSMRTPPLESPISRS